MIVRPLIGVVAGTVASFVALSACSAQTPTAAQVESEADWRDMPLAPGTWVYRRDERGSVALFGEPNNEASFLVRCALPERRIYFSREGVLEGGGTMAFRTTHGDKSYAAQAGSGPEPYVVAMAEARDDFLDKIAFSRGRITVAATGQPVIAVPNWPEMTRVFEDCRG